MFGIFDFIFGKKVKVAVANLGIFEARVKKNKQKEITWSTEQHKTSSNRTIVLLLLGNGKGPYQSQIESAQSILKDEEKIKLQVIEELLKDSEQAQKFQGQNTADYKLTWIYPNKDKGIAYELAYESDNGEYIAAIFKDYAISEVLFSTS